jgi:hypothetical protein
MFEPRTPYNLSKLGLVLLLLLAATAHAQQPFVTDNTDTTPKGHFHFEFSNEFDWLQRSAFPNLKQNTADFELDYGILDDLLNLAINPVLMQLDTGSMDTTKVPREMP